MDKNLKIAVTSKTFSTNSFLKEELLKVFPQVTFNTEGKKFSSKELIHFLKDSQAAIIALDKINEKILQELPHLKIISKYGVGLDNLDLKALSKFNVKLGWKAGVNKRSVSELVLFFSLGQMRNSFEQVYSMKNQDWNPITGKNLSGKTFGIIGMGHVGQDLVQLLKPFGCRILFADILDKKAVCESYSIEQVSLDQLLSTSDIISLHVPKNEKTTNLISSKEFSLMKPETIFINTSRGGIVDEKALLVAMKNHSIRSCLDVFLEEPTANSELLKHPGFFATPHIGGSTEESIRLMGLAAIEGLSQYQDPSFYENC